MQKKQQHLGNVIEEGVIVSESPSAAAISLNKNDWPYRIFGILTVFITFGVLLGWAGSAPLASAIIAPGQIVVSSRNKIVQHYDGGRVKNIYFKEGDIVQKGDTIIRLDSEDLRAQLESTQSQIWQSQASQERLIAERDEKELKFSATLLSAAAKSKTLKDILNTQKNIFILGSSTLNQSSAILTQRKKQANEQILGNKNVLSSLYKRKALLEEDIASMKTLVSRNLLPRNNLRDKQGQYSELLEDIASRQSDSKRLAEVITEQSQQKNLEKKQFLQNVNLELRDLERQRIELIASKRRLRDLLSRVEIIAPVTGKIEKFDIVTIGAVIQAGKPLFEIVPLSYDFTILANISSTDIDNIYVGQEAEIRLSVFDDSRYFEVLYAKIENIAADTTTDEKSGASYYKTKIEVSKEIIDELKDKKVKLVSGMSVEVVIKTSERTVFDYLVKPLKEMVDRSFNEH